MSADRQFWRAGVRAVTTTHGRNGGRQRDAALALLMKRRPWLHPPVASYAEFLRLCPDVQTRRERGVDRRFGT